MIDRRAVVALGVRMAVGLVLLVVGWVGAADEVALDRQAPWIAVSVTGMLVGAGAAALWLLESRRAVRARVLAVVAAVDSIPLATEADGGDLRVHRRGSGLYHRPGCALVAGRRVQRGDAAAWTAGGLIACEACGA